MHEPRLQEEGTGDPDTGADKEVEPNLEKEGTRDPDTSADKEVEPNFEDSVSEEETETESLLPEMYFHPNEYKKAIKISSRCFIKEAVEKINRLGKHERRWFHEHPQFKHFFHMTTSRTHKVQGMWMLLLRTARTSKVREAWFIVNGVPIRYSIREHGLISGLYCHNYPLNWKRMGDTDFVDRNFELGSTITYESIKHKLLSMRPCRDRLQMAVLYFLSRVIPGNTKRGKRELGEGAPAVDEFFLRAANDLELCRTFPWGRYSFYDNLAQMKNLLDKFNGVMEKDGWCYPRFNIPLQLLAYEAIPDLKTKFIYDFMDDAPHCPRMCKSTFKKIRLTGFPLSKINAALGTTKNITSILKPYIVEAPLMKEIFDHVEDIPDVGDYIVETWHRRLEDEGRLVFFECIFNEDVKARGAGEQEIPPVPPMLATEPVELRKSMEDGFKKVLNVLGRQDERLKVVETSVQSQRSGVAVSGGTISFSDGIISLSDDRTISPSDDETISLSDRTISLSDDETISLSDDDVSVSSGGGGGGGDDDAFSGRGSGGDDVGAVSGGRGGDDAAVAVSGDRGGDDASAAVSGGGGGDDAAVSGGGGDDDVVSGNDVGDDAAAVSGVGDVAVSEEEEEVVGEKRLRRPAAACKSPYTAGERKKNKNA